MHKPRGLALDVAMWRLLSVRGITLSLARLREQSNFDGSTESLQVTLAQYRIDARGVIIHGPHELAALALPTLVQCSDESWLLLRACRRGEVVYEGADGVGSISLPALMAHLSGHVMELAPSLPDGNGLGSRLLQLLHAHRSALLQFTLLSALLHAFALLTPELTGVVMGRALPDGATHLLHLVAAAVVATAVLSGALGWLRGRLTLYLLTCIEVAFKRGLLEHILRLPFAELQRRNLGDFLQAFYGLSSARTMLAERTLGALFDGVLAVGFLLLMGVKLLAPTLVMLLVIAAMVIMSALVGRAQARLQEAEVVAQARQSGYLTQLLAGIRTIKSAGAEQQCHREWAMRFGAERSLTLRRSRTGLWTDIGLPILRQVASMTLLLWGGYAVLQGEIGFGTLFSFLLLSEGFLTAVLSLITTGLLLMVSSRQLMGVRDLLHTAAQPPRTYASHCGGLFGSIVMNDIWFRYSNDGPWILQGYNLRIEPGAKHCLQGPSGSGKSTILRLLAGLYTPERGTITIAGRDVRSSSTRALYLPQFVQLNSGSIIDNMRSLSGGASGQRLRDAALRTGFDQVISAMVLGYQTPIPLGGRTLSGGQRQLLALTAALGSNCELLLLDEPMANIDPIAQAQLSKLIASESRTVISVVHS